jgi:hypothetical protein
MLLLNAFSINMLSGRMTTLTFSQIPQQMAGILARRGIESAVGHASTAAVFSAVLGVPVPCERRTVTISDGEPVLIGQYRGPRLSEGATELPEGATVEWWIVGPAAIDLPPEPRECTCGSGMPSPGVTGGCNHGTPYCG